MSRVAADQQSSAWDNSARIVGADTHVGGVGGAIGGQGNSVGGSLVEGGGGNNVVEGSVVDSVASNSIIIGEGKGVVDRESISLCLSLSLDNVLDWSILGNVLWCENTVGDSSVLVGVVVVGHSMAGNLGLGIDNGVDSSVVGDSGGSNSLVGDSWGGNRLFVGNSWNSSIISNSRCNSFYKGSCNSMAVGVDSSVVGEGEVV